MSIFEEYGAFMMALMSTLEIILWEKKKKKKKKKSKYALCIWLGLFSPNSVYE